MPGDESQQIMKVGRVSAIDNTDLSSSQAALYVQENNKYQTIFNNTAKLTGTKKKSTLAVWRPRGKEGVAKKSRDLGGHLTAAAHISQRNPRDKQ